MTCGMSSKPAGTPTRRACAARVTSGGPTSAMGSRPAHRAGAVALPVLLLIVLTGCRGSDAEHAEADHRDGLGGLVSSADPVAPDLAGDVESAATDPAALMRAVKVPHHRLAESLGAHVFRATSTVDTTVTGGGEPEARETLAVTARIEYADAQRFRAVVENSADYGREIIFTGGQLYLRPRYGAFHRRAPNDHHEPAGWRDDIYGELAGHLELLAVGLAVRDGGAVDVAGRPALRIELARAEVPRALPPPQAPQRAWRSSVEVESLSGEILLDRDTGLPLRARLEGVAHARREQRLVRMHVVVEHGIEDIGQVVAIEPPPEAQWVDTPVRSREVDDRAYLLDDIAQPARPAPTPANTPTGDQRRRRPQRGAAQESP